MIYMVEDDESIRELVLYTLRSAGFEAEGFERGEELFEALGRRPAALILLDIMLPGDDGFTLLKKLRANRGTEEVPIMMLTARGAEYDKVLGLDAGADDYLSKPFGMMELLSRVKALLRRTARRQGAAAGVLRCGLIELDPASRRATVAGEEKTLTRKEFDLLYLFLKNPGVVLTRDRLMAEVWGADFAGETRTVDVQVSTLRQKLGQAGDAIETVRGVGYRMEEKT
ncbi:MAG: response regulator transcription factor [Oscillospiraceae bacterium]|nr:response regulator transcription factor [Oscillospiraceae bacterium]